MRLTELILLLKDIRTEYGEIEVVFGNNKFSKQDINFAQIQQIFKQPDLNSISKNHYLVLSEEKHEK